MSTKQKGDRRDATLVRTKDPMRNLMMYMMGDRTDNEAVVNEDFVCDKALEYIKNKNDLNPQYRYTVFHFIVAAMAKTIYLRPLMNRYIVGVKVYQRHEISFAFTIKNKMSDNGSESLMILVAENNGTSLIDQIHDKITKEVYKVRKDTSSNDTTAAMSLLTKIPGPVLKAVVKVLFWLNKHDWLPEALYKVDPYRATVFITNLGSINTHAQYHHLINWSLNSLFVIANKIEKKPVFNEDGSYEMHSVFNIGATLDERIADGFYFARSLEVLRYIFEHPEVLDEPLDNPIDFVVKH